MNIGDLVKISAEAGSGGRLFLSGDIGIIIQEMETSWSYVDEGAPIDSSFPELFFSVYNFAEKAVLIYNSFEMKILNKAALQTSKGREEI
jgi:hypothetical protein|tara:strand:- start:8450 stop:8719 length:270 start_codon:yes stop_codon:yes gene_type:complete